MITIKDIAAETGLSITTVSLVLSGKAEARGIALGTRQRIEQVAEQMGYRRNGFARALRTGRSNRIGIAGVNFSHPVALMAMRAAAEAVLEHNFSVTLTDLAWQPDQPERVVDDLVGQRVEGLVVLGSRGLSDPQGREALQRLALQGLPMVMLDPLGLEGVDLVTVDREAGAYLAIRHLLELGHRRIVMTVDTESRALPIRSRMRGYLRAHEEAGVTPDPALFWPPGVGMPSYEDGRRLADRFLREDSRPTAVFFVNDRVAMGALHELLARGVRVPDELSIVGFDGLEEAAYAAVPLTTVVQPMAEVAGKAIELLIDRIQDNEAAGEPRRVVISPQLAVRRSSGPPPLSPAK